MRSRVGGVDWRTGTKDAWEPGSPTAHRFVIAIEGTGLTGPGQPLGAAGEQQQQSVTEGWADRQAGIGKWTARLLLCEGAGGRVSNRLGSAASRKDTRARKGIATAH
jgi:hypothetical protein